MLFRNDIHGFIGVVEVIPSRTLMRRITCPNHSKLIDLLGFRPPNATISPRACADICPIICEFVHYRTDDCLSMLECWKAVDRAKKGILALKYSSL